MSETFPVVYLARHGETAWSLSGQHTGLTDLPLTERGERNAASLAGGSRGLSSRRCSRARCSAPRARARWPDSAASRKSTATSSSGTTANTKAGPARDPCGPPRLVLFRDGCPGGESPAEVAARADRVVRRLRGLNGDVRCSRPPISCACSRPAGSALTFPRAATSSWGPARCACWATSTTAPSR